MTKIRLVLIACLISGTVLMPSGVRARQERAVIKQFVGIDPTGSHWEVETCSGETMTIRFQSPNEDWGVVDTTETRVGDRYDVNGWTWEMVGER